MTMKLTSKGRQVIDEVPWGVYLWMMPGRKFVSDDEGHQLMIQSMRGDKKRIEALRNAVKDFGIEEGEPVFFPGHRIVTDEEYEEQRQRLLFGLIPDPMDVAAIEEARNASKRR